MSRRKIFLYGFGFFLLLILIAIVINVSATNDPPSSGGTVNGDWIVDSSKKYTSCTITLRGNLIIISSGNLVFNNVTLIIDGTVDGQRRIELQTGGAFTATSSKITSSNAQIEYRFVIYRGASFIATRTDISEVGYRTTPIDEHSGLYIYSDNVSIDRCTIRNCAIGLIIDSCNPTISSTTIKDITGVKGPDRTGSNGGDGQSVYGIYIINGASPTIYDVTITNLRGGNGGSSTTADGGNGGDAIAIESLFSTPKIKNLTIVKIMGGKGGTGGKKGGDGGEAYAMLCIYSPLIAENITISKVIGGYGSTGGGDGGVGEGGYGICSLYSYINTSNISIDNITGGDGGNAWLNDGGGGGMAFGIIIIESDTSTIENISEVDLHGGKGGKAGTFGKRGENGTSIGIFSLYGDKSLRIYNLSMRHANIGMMISNGSKNIVNNFALSNLTYGFFMFNNTITLSNGTTTSSVMIAVMATSNSDLKINKCNFQTQFIGLSIKDSKILANECIIANASGGIMLNRTNAIMDSCIIEGNSDMGLIVASDSSVDIIDGAIKDNHNYGIISDKSSKVTWEIYKTGKLINDRILIKGDIIIHKDGNFITQDSEIYFIISNPCEYGITSEGRLNSSKTMFKSWTGIAYYFKVRGSMLMDSCEVYDVGLQGSPDISGIYITSDDVLINNTEIQKCAVGLVFDNSKGKIKNSVISDCMWGILSINGAEPFVLDTIISICECGVYLEGGSLISESMKISACTEAIHATLDSKVKFLFGEIRNCDEGLLSEKNSSIHLINSTVKKCRRHAIHGMGGKIIVENSTVSDSGAECVYLEDNTFVIFLNSKFSSLFFADEKSTVEVWWYLHVITKWQNGLVIDNASVTILSSKGTKIFSGKTDKNGEINWIKIKEKSITKLESDVFTPHNVTADKFGEKGWKEITVNETKRLEITITDLNLPEIKITHPEDNHIQNTTDITIRGTAKDNVGLLRIEVSYDNKTWLIAEGLQEWICEFNLTDGYYIIKARAIDITGNINISTVRVIIDTTAPSINITSPKDGDIFNAKNITVTGKTEKNVKLYVNKEMANVSEDGNFTANIILKNEGENIILVIAEDSAGNKAEVRIVVILDTTPPEITVSHPVNGTETNIKVIKVMGNVTDAKTLTINGENVEIKNNTFAYDVNLSEGTNIIIIEGVDVAGNSREIRIIVILDTQIFLNITSPDNGTLTNKRYIEIIGTTEENAYVLVNGINVKNINGTFTINITLNEGKNEISIIVEDKAGNKIEKIIVIFSDTIPPAILSIEPKTNYETKHDNITINGKVEVGSRVLINGEEVKVSTDGQFSCSVSLNFGENIINITVIDSAGNINTTSIIIKRVKETKIESSEVIPILIAIIIIIVAVIGGVIATYYYIKREKTTPPKKEISDIGEPDEEKIEDIEKIPIQPEAPPTEDEIKKIDDVEKDSEKDDEIEEMKEDTEKEITESKEESKESKNEKAEEKKEDKKEDKKMGTIDEILDMLKKE